VIENNRYAMGTEISRASAEVNLSRRGLSFNIPGEQVDGMDVRAVKAAGDKAAAWCRAGKGPFILEMLTYRYRGHSMSDPAKYRTREEVDKVRTMHDPIDMARHRILEKKFANEDGLKKIDICEVLGCNWLQAMENSVDPTHTYYLHSHTLKTKGTRDFVPFHYQRLSKIDFELVVNPTWAGIQKQRTFAGKDGPVESPHPLVFPNILFVPVRMGYAMHFRTPIDDQNTQVIQFRFAPSKDGSVVAQPEDAPIEYIRTKNEDGEFHMENFSSQDHMAWETQGPIADRTNEHLGEGDRGVIMYRKLLREQILAVQEGRDPVGVNRDPKKDEVIRLIHEGFDAFSFAAAQAAE